MGRLLSTRTAIIAIGILFAGLLAPVAAAQPGARILGLRIGNDPETTRIVIDSDTPLKYKVFSLAAGTERIIIDLPKVRWSIDGLTAESGNGAGGGLVAGYRYAHNTATTSRLVLDLAGPALVNRDFVIGPSGNEPNYRIVMDLKAASHQIFAKKAAADLSKPHTAPHRQVRKPLVVVDAGHGGKDPGTISPNKTMEKDITLAAAIALRDALLQTNRYDVSLTRDTDVFLELEDRVTRARDLGADLFVSLHADAVGKATTRGASVYTLSPEGEKRVETARQKHDWVLSVETDHSRPKEVNQILADLVQRETKNQSARFAQMLVPALERAGWPALTNTHRKRGFYVLLSPDVPAILLEMGFLTNAEDEKMLKSHSHRKRLVAGVVSAIDEFFETEARALAMR